MDKDKMPWERGSTDRPPGEDNGLSLATKVYVCLIILATLTIVIGYIVPKILSDVWYWLEPKCPGSGTRAYCRMAEQDAMNVMASLASYFSDPNNMRIPSIETLRRHADFSLIYDNPEPTIWPPEGSNVFNYNTIRVTVYDKFDCCWLGSAYIATGNPFKLQGGYWEK